MSRIIALVVFVALAIGGGAAVQMRGQAPPAGGDSAATALAGQHAGGGAFSLRELRGAPVTLVFVRSGQCGLCMLRMRALGERLAAYERLGAHVVVVTGDAPDLARAAAREAGFDATVVSVEAEVLRAWGLWPEGVAAPLPGEFIVAADGSVVFAHRGSSAAGYIGDVELLGVLRRHVAERRAAS